MRGETIKKQKATVFVIPLDRVEHPRADNVRFNYFLKALRESGDVIGLERVPYFDTNRQTVRYIRYLSYCLRVLWLGLREAKNIDVIFADHVSFGVVGAILAVLTRKPMICDIDEGNVLAHCRFTGASWLFTRLNLILERFIGYAATVLAVPSEIDVKLYSEQSFRYRDKLAVIPSGIDLSTIPQINQNTASLRTKLGLPLDKRLLIYMGKRQYFPNKEAAFWINDELAPRLAREFDDVRIVICGSGEVPAQIHPIVKFAGHVPEIYEYICASDICIVPYKLDAGISLKVLDAMACGKPVVTMYWVANLFSNLVDGENVIIAKDRTEFAEKVIWLLKNPELYRKIGGNGRKLIERQYNWEVISKTWNGLIDNLWTGKIAGKNANYVFHDIEKTQGV